MREEDVHAVLPERLRHGPEQSTHPFRVTLMPLLGGTEQRRGVAEPAFGDERHARHEGTFGRVACRDLDEGTLPRRNDPGHHGHTDQPEQLGERFQPSRRVVVARDGHDRDTGLVQADQRLEDEGVGLRGRGVLVVQVARHEDGVRPLLDRDPHDFAQGLLELLGPGTAAERPADVPVGGVQEPHPSSLPSRVTRITSM